MEMQNIKGKSAEDRVFFNLLKLRKKEEKLNPQPSGKCRVLYRQYDAKTALPRIHQAPYFNKALLFKRKFVTSDHAHAWSATVLKRHFFYIKRYIDLSVSSPTTRIHKTPQFN